MNRWMDGCMNGWMHEWTDRWMNDNPALWCCTELEQESEILFVSSATFFNFSTKIVSHNEWKALFEFDRWKTLIQLQRLFFPGFRFVIEEQTWVWQLLPFYQHLQVVSPPCDVSQILSMFDFFSLGQLLTDDRTSRQPRRVGYDRIIIRPFPYNKICTFMIHVGLAMATFQKPYLQLY